MKQKRSAPKKLLIDAKITSTGIDVFVNGDRFPILYPKKVWHKFPKELKEILKDNLAYSSTIFLPQILNLKEIVYKTARPLSETFLFKNGIYDMACSAQTDEKSSAEYVKRFYNTRYIFADERIKTPKRIDLKNGSKNKRTLIPFSFGKESMLSFALSKELGLEPFLVNTIEPVHIHELTHKKKLIESFKKTMGIHVDTIRYGPGIMRYGHYWDLETELGTGLWVTDYVMLSLPFIYFHDIYFIALGNEQSCNDVYYDKEEMLTYRSAYDQFREWTSQLSYLSTLLYGKKLEVMSLVEPLYEIAETKVLHKRYSDYGKHQLSCFAMQESARYSRWCQNCYKCAYLYPLFAAFNIDPKSLSFTENLFDKKHAHLYKTFFTRLRNSVYYGSQEELAVAFYLAMKNGATGYSMDRFKKELLPDFIKHKKKYFKKYLGIHPTYNIPPQFKKKIMDIYKKELKEFQ